MRCLDLDPIRKEFKRTLTHLCKYPEAIVVITSERVLGQRSAVMEALCVGSWPSPKAQNLRYLEAENFINAKVYKNDEYK